MHVYVYMAPEATSGPPVINNLQNIIDQNLYLHEFQPSDFNLFIYVAFLYRNTYHQE